MNFKEMLNCFENFLIYYFDVVFMYFNIMMINWLQLDFMILELDCVVCDFNWFGKICDRRLLWVWRGEYLLVKCDEYNMIWYVLESECFLGKRFNMLIRLFGELFVDEQVSLIRKRLQFYL